MFCSAAVVLYLFTSTENYFRFRLSVVDDITCVLLYCSIAVICGNLVAGSNVVHCSNILMCSGVLGIYNNIVFNAYNNALRYILF